MALLGREVRDLALDRARLRHPPVVRLRDAEVDDLDDALAVDEHVRRRHVAVHDPEWTAIDPAPLVRVVQPGRDAGDDRQHRLQRDLSAQRTRAQHEVAHGLAVHVLHREEVRAAEAADIVDLRDVRVLELDREARLVEEHPYEVDVARSLAQDSLQDDDAIRTGRSRREREEDLGHSALRDLGEHGVRVGGRSDLHRHPGRVCANDGRSRHAARTRSQPARSVGYCWRPERVGAELRRDPREDRVGALDLAFRERGAVDRDAVAAQVEHLDHRVGGGVDRVDEVVLAPRIARRRDVAPAARERQKVDDRARVEDRAVAEHGGRHFADRRDLAQRRLAGVGRGIDAIDRLADLVRDHAHAAHEWRRRRPVELHGRTVD